MTRFHCRKIRSALIHETHGCLNAINVLAMPFWSSIASRSLFHGLNGRWHLTPTCLQVFAREIYRQMAAAYALMGHSDEAKEALGEAGRLDHFVTARSDIMWFGSEAAIKQTRRFQEGLRVAGLRDHADEDADFAVTPDLQLRRVTMDTPRRRRRVRSRSEPTISRRSSLSPSRS